MKKKILGILLSAALLFQGIGGASVAVHAAVAAPQLTATVPGSNEVSLSWNNISADVEYQIWRSANDGQFDELQRVAQNTYTDSTVTENTKYRYKVVAKSASENSPDSNTVTVYTDITSPTAPGNLQLLPTVNSVYMSWEPSTDNAGMGIDKYNIYGRGANQGTFSVVGSTTDVSYTHASLTPGTSYYYYITAIDRAGNESQREADIRTADTLPDTEPPQAPTGLTANVSGESRIDLTWNQPTDNVGIVGYTVYRSAANTNDGFTGYNSTARNYSLTGLTSGTTYYIKVVAFDASGNRSEMSNTVAVTTQRDTQKPTPPSLWALATSSTQVKLTWSGATDDKGVIGYEVYRAVGSSSSFSRIASDDASPYYDSTVSSGSTYKYYVKAKDAAGNLSDSSNTVNVTANGDTQSPTAPTNFRLSLVNNREVRLTWSSSSDNQSVSGYKIFRSLESDSYAYITSTTGTSYNDTGLNEGKNYRYYIKAYDAAGNESDSSDTQSIYTSTSARSDVQTISASGGGTLEIPDLIKLEIPRDALSRNAEYKLITKAFSSYSTSGFKTFGQPVDITAKVGSTNQTSFNKDLTVTFYYTSSELGSTSKSQLAVYYWDTSKNAWIRLSSTVSSSPSKVTAKTDHLTVFALLADASEPSVPTLTTSSTATHRNITLTGKAEANSRVDIMLNGSTFSVNADSSGNFSKEVYLVPGTNEVKLRAEDAAGNQSAWSGIKYIQCTLPVVLSDVLGHWAERNIEKVIERGITSGYEDKSFRPNRTITRAEFCKFVVAACGYSAIDSPQLAFKDKRSIPQWSRGFIARAVEKGLISGYGDGYFRADKEITRQEMAAVLIRAMNLQGEAMVRQDYLPDFTDASQIQPWARGAVAVAVEKGLIKGYSDATFGPGRSATRAEAVTMIVIMMEKK